MLQMFQGKSNAKCHVPLNGFSFLWGPLPSKSLLPQELLGAFKQKFHLFGWFSSAVVVILDRTSGSIWVSPAIPEAESFSYLTHHMKSIVWCEELWTQAGRLLSWDNIVNIERFAGKGGRRKGILGRWNQESMGDVASLDSCREFLLSCFPLSSEYWGLPILSCPESWRKIPFFELENQICVKEGHDE